MALVKRQFELGRQAIFKDVEELDPVLLDVQLEGWSNTIRWQLGHLLVAAESFLFGGNGQLPVEYNDWFGYGSRPSEWKSDVPSADVIIHQLKEQLERIKGIPVDRFEEKLEQPVLGNNTYGELVYFTAYHELNHAGQIHLMARLVNKK
ncbi:DinB family protein [Bacillus kwashiorkori]|uniref:DinB family protein n=1 Tax=Bacillus kwashiorkori TaxID=1522318 RepID=UPI000783CABC|nr:DinB family protein [Bacillus kwashiorkori]